MKKNYKLQNTNYKQITNHKIQITNGGASVAFYLLVIPNDNVQNYKEDGVFEIDQASNQLIINPKGGYDLHKDSFRLQIITAFNQKLLRGVQGGGFLEKSPPGRRRQENEI